MTRTAVRKERAEPVARSVVRRDVTGTELGTVDLEPTVFGIEPNQAVLHQVVTAQLAAARAGTQSTKTRAEVRGGGAKPFRQKGTGRARQGSTRSPSWAGGGVALGPKPRSYRQRTPKKMVRLALCSALSDRAAQERIAVVDTWGWDEPKTKAAAAALDALGLTGRVLVVLDYDDIVAERSFGNLPTVQITQRGELSAYDVLRNDWIVFTDQTLPGADVVEVVEIIDTVDEETGEEVIEIIDTIVDTGTGKAVIVDEVIDIDADGNEVDEIEVVEVDADGNALEVVDEVEIVGADGDGTDGDDPEADEGGAEEEQS
ncbi:MAG TPA: 50S ribosomal protein L4 [Acidimicrobiales bacterium]|nr:50S ribosomal protein L4 [Acidimicrobiales bacterium]